MEKNENLEIKKAPEELTKQDLEKVTGGAPPRMPVLCEKNDSESACTKNSCASK